MDTLIDRLDALLAHLGGMSQRRFCLQIDVAPGSYNNWKNGDNRPNRDNLEAIRDRWQVSIDSVLAAPGTDRLEPSPALRNVQEALLWELSQRDMPGSIEERVTYLRDRIKDATGMTEEAWCEWLQIASVEHTRWSGDTTALRSAAFLAGWYDNHHAWLAWLKTGQADVLEPLGKAQIQRMVEMLVREKGVTYSDLRRLLKIQWA